MQLQGVDDGIDVFRKLAGGGTRDMRVVVRGGLNVFLADEAAGTAEFEGVVDAWEVLYRGSEVDAGFRNGPEIDEVFKYGTGTCRAAGHGISLVNAERRFSSEVDGRKEVVSIVRAQERMVDPGVFGCGDGEGWTREGSASSRLARKRAASK